MSFDWDPIHDNSGNSRVTHVWPAPLSEARPEMKVTNLEIFLGFEGLGADVALEGSFVGVVDEHVSGEAALGVQNLLTQFTRKA